jgi:hypothetical protein
LSGVAAVAEAAALASTALSGAAALASLLADGTTTVMFSSTVRVTTIGAGFDVVGGEVVGGDVVGALVTRRETVVVVDEPTAAAVVLVRLASRVATIFAAAPVANTQVIAPAVINALRRFMLITISRGG